MSTQKPMFSSLRGNSGGTWAMRAGVALFAGLVVGVGGGFLGLRVLMGDTPPEPVIEKAPEPVMPAPRRTYSGPRADGMRAADGKIAMVGGGAVAARDSVAVVPDLVGRAEGDARGLLERAGFSLGEILFRQSDEPLGTVLETFPVPGERVQLPATVNLILADRRRSVEPPLPFGYSSDSLGVLGDTLGAQGNTIGAPAHTLGVSPDSATVRSDSALSVPDSSAHDAR